jgi:hypothetical protein
MTTAPEFERYEVPDAPRVRKAIKAALSDFFFNSWRLVPANIVWGIGLIVVVLLALTAPLLGLFALVTLALPTVGIFRVAALAAREQPVTVGDSISAWREFLRPALAVGAVIGATAIVLVFNMVSGFASMHPLGWGLATMAAWGFAALFAFSVAVWPLIADPVRDGEPLRARVELAGAVIVRSPGAYLGLMIVLFVIIVASTVAAAALLTISMSFIALVACRYVLPAADRLEGRRTKSVPTAE